VRTWKLTLEYDGTRYSGWQEQKNAKTVMGELRAAAEVCFHGEVELHGAGRTDAGVHAAAQVAHLRIKSRRKHSPEDVVRELNDKLPADIAVIEAREAADRFHARRDAVARTYVYQISRRKSAFSKKYVWWIKEPLDVKAMKKAASLLVGRHDFVNFRAADPSRPDESTIVEVNKAWIDEEDDLILFRIDASHFLWRMVRRLAGTLVRVGRHEITLDDFRTLLEGQPPAHTDVPAWTAPSSGLFLEKVTYREERR
jgi:tRNA pseudouridine38-40 synthase